MAIIHRQYFTNALASLSLGQELLKLKIKQIQNYKMALQCQNTLLFNPFKSSVQIRACRASKKIFTVFAKLIEKKLKTCPPEKKFAEGRRAEVAREKTKRSWRKSLQILAVYGPQFVCQI